MTSKRPLNERQQAFAREYLIDLAPSAAARRAGYKGNVKQQAYALLQDERIQALIHAEMSRRAERVEDSADEVLRDLRRLGKKAEELLEFAAALKAVELRGKHLGMFKDRVEHSGPAGAPIETITRIELVALLPNGDGADSAAT